MPGKFLHYSGGEELIVRRLGAAVVSLWNELPEDKRVKIVEKASFLFDKYYSVGLSEQIRIFINDHAE